MPSSESTRSLDAGEAGRLLRAIVAEPEVELKSQPERRVGRYVLDELIGRGGSGGVYRAYTDGSDVPVAIKVLSHSLSSEARSRAVREAEVLGELRLECVPRFIESGLHHGVPFIATELVEGLPLDEHAKGKTREQRIELLARVAVAVQSLHEHGVLHRDLKPSNVLIDPRGRPVIVDLGLAHSSARDHTLTAEGQPLGTVAFMSPEQARGELGAVSIRSDVYSLGAIAYQLELGQPPHNIETSIHEAIRRIAQDPPRDPRTLDPQLPKELAAVLCKACAMRSADRYASAGEFAQDLRRWLRGEAVEAIAPGRWRRAMRWAAGHPVAVTAMACAAIATTSLLGTVMAVKWLNDRPHSVMVDPDYDARLVSRTGKTLYEWEGRRATLGRVIERPAELGGDRIVLLAFVDELEGELRACDVDNPDRTLWAHGDDPSDLVIPPREEMTNPQLFAVQQAQVVEVMAESPGPEVVAVHRSNLTGAAAIRIYDLAGNILFEAWHEGVLYEFYWMEEPGLLVLTGVNSEVNWKDRGHPEVTDAWPSVVLAIKPSLGARHGWISTPTRPGDFEPAWYRGLLSPAAADRFLGDTQLRIQGPEDGDPRTHADLLAGLVRFRIDREGVVKKKTAMAGVRQQMSTPAERALLEALHLGDLPPIVPKPPEPTGELPEKSTRFP